MKVKTLTPWKVDQKKAKNELSNINNIYIRREGVPQKCTKVQKEDKG